MIRNLRDLGGIRNREGKTVRRGLLVRSAQLSEAEEKDLAGIAAVIDLRTPGERREAPDQTRGREYLPMPIFDDVQAGISHESGTENQVVPEMTVMYSRMMKECTGSYAAVMRTILQHDFTAGAVLWHCTEGKDRCGMVTALVLEALGVGRDAILADYLKTNAVNLPRAEAYRERLTVSHGPEFAERIYRAYIADEAYLRAAWDVMGDHYLQDRLGLQEEELARFRDIVLE